MIDKGELKVREYEIYCGYYCGICKSIGSRYGQLPRMTLSYDAAFLAVMLAGLSAEPDAPQQEHCIGHHIKNKTIIYNRAVDYAGDVMLLLAWYKLKDDASDENRLYAKGTMVLFRKIYAKLRREYSSLCDDMEAYLDELSGIEKEKCASIDMAAESFSKIMELIFDYGVRTVYGSSNAAVSSIGYHLGKWIYLIDAVDDIEENIDTGSYNPLLYRFEYDNKKETPEEFRSRIEDDLRFNLFHYLAVISNSVNTLEIKKNQGIIENIIYLGLNHKTEEIIAHRQPEKRRRIK